MEAGPLKSEYEDTTILSCSSFLQAMYPAGPVYQGVYDIQFCRFLSFFSFGAKVEDVDDTYAALALMYGYAARYAPSTVIEARINALVVCIYKQTFFLT